MVSPRPQARPILVSWSSGKDSAWTLHLLPALGFEPAALLTTFDSERDRVGMHGVARRWVRRQAAALGLELLEVEVPFLSSNERYAEAHAAAWQEARDRGLRHVAFGDLFLDDIRRFREGLLEGTGLEPIFPLWGRPTDELALEMIAGGLEAWVTCVDPKQLSPDRLGRRFDRDFVTTLPDGVDPCGERGEFHTFVTWGPGFGERLDARPIGSYEHQGFCYVELSEPD